MTTAKTLVLALLGITLTAAAVGAQAPDAKAIAAGKKLFSDKNCIKCHSAEGVGNKKMPMEGISAKVTPEDMKKWITSPVEMTAKLPKKPAVPMKKIDLQPAEVDQVIAYLSSLK